MTQGGHGFVPPVSILGVGAVTPLGRRLDDIAQKLVQRPELQPVSRSAYPQPAPGAPGRDPQFTVRRVPDELLSDPPNSRRLRRADRFVRMGVAAAQDAWAEAKPSCEGISMERVGLIVASGLGPHVRGFKFLDGLLDCGDTAALPTDFSHSVHGAAAAYIAEILGVRGPSLTTTDFEMGFEQAVLLAQCWLARGACDRVLVGAVEELGDVMTDCASQLLKGDTRFVPSEGAVFLTLGPAGVPSPIQLDAAVLLLSVDLVATQEPPTPPRTKRPMPIMAQHTTSFSACFGHSASSAAFELLGVLLAMGVGAAAVPGAIPGAVDSAATVMPISDTAVATLVVTRNQA